MREENLDYYPTLEKCLFLPKWEFRGNVYIEDFNGKGVKFNAQNKKSQRLKTCQNLSYWIPKKMNSNIDHCFKGHITFESLFI